MNNKRLVIAILSITSLTIIGISLLAVISFTTKPTEPKISVESLTNEQLLSTGISYIMQDSSSLASNYISSQYSLLPEFDYETFTNNCMSAINEQIATSSHNITVQNMGKSTVETNEYQHYKTSISISELANIIKPAILFALKNPELQSYIDMLYDMYYSDTDNDYDNLYFDYTVNISSQMSGISVMLDSHWSILISQLTEKIGESVDVDLYLTKDINVAICTVTFEDGTILNISNVDDKDFVTILENIQYYYEKIFNTY